MSKLTIRQDGDRSLQTRIPITGEESTHVLLSVSFAPGRGYTLSAVPAEVNDETGSFRCMLMDHEFHRLEKATRFNAKRLRELAEGMIGEVEGGQGAAANSSVVVPCGTIL